MQLKKITEYNVKLFSEKKGLSQEELSRLIGKNDKFISNLENGKYIRAVNINVLNLISKQLDIKVKDLFDDIVEESEYNER